MRSSKKRDRFTVFVFISIIIHLLLLVFIPIGDLSVMGSDNDSNRDFGFIQVVEYKTPEPVKHVKTEVKAKPKPEKKLKPKTKPVSKPEVKAEPKPKPDLKPKSKPKLEPKQKTELNSETNPKPESKSKPKSKTESGNEQNIISSDKSNVEIKVEKEKKNEGVKGNNDEKVNKTENMGEKEQKVVEKTKTPPPPPPPTAGDLIINAPVPNYPKDLVGEASSGEVELLVNVKADGKVQKVEIIKSSGFEQMDRTATLTIERGWKFDSYNKPYTITIKVSYKIDEAGNSNVNVQNGKLSFK